MHLVWYFHHIFSKWWCPYSQINDDFKLPINFLIRFFFILINDLGAKICNSYLSIFINCKKFQSCFSNISSIQQGIHTYIRCFVFVRVFSNTCFQIGLQILCPSGEKSRLVVFVWLFTPLRLQLDFFDWGKVTVTAFIWLFHCVFSISRPGKIDPYVFSVGLHEEVHNHISICLTRHQWEFLNA